MLEKSESTEILWKSTSKDTTKKIIQKKQKNKKTGAVRTINKTVEQDSFFNFFKGISLPDADAMDDMEKDKIDEIGGKLDEDYDLGNDILNDIIPEAFELYIGVVDRDYSTLNSGTESDDDGEGEGDNNDDDKSKSPAADNEKADPPADSVPCKQQ